MQPIKPAFNTDTSSPILNAIKEGMDVYDQLGNKIGTVQELYFGASSQESNRNGAGSATAPSPDMNKGSFVEDLARAFAPDEMPQVMRDRLIMSGFVKLNSEGLFKHARYIVPSQIDNVTDNRVNLRVSRDELIRRDSAQE